MKRMSRVTKYFLLLAGFGIIVQSCASSRSACDCNDLNNKYKPPKSYKRNIY